MDLWEIIASNFVSFIFGTTLTNIWNKSKNMIREKSIKKNIIKVITRNSEDICTIASTVPFYQNNSCIDIKINNKNKFYLSLPDNMKTNQNINVNEFKSIDCINIDIEYESLGITKTKFWTILEEQRQIVANSFASRTGGMYFNGEKYGVLYSDGFGRTADKIEDPKLFIELFKTDYYTQRIIEKTLHKINIRNKIDLNFLNQSMRGLRPSLGVSIILYIPDSNEIILTKRSKHASYNEKDKEWIYVSVTESFTTTDYDEFQKTPDLILCIQRGLKEELGIDKNTIQDIKIYNMFFEKNFFQDGILAVAYLNKYITYQDVVNLAAKDKELEISSFLPIKNSKNELHKFITANSKNLRPQTKYALENYIERMSYLYRE